MRSIGDGKDDSPALNANWNGFLFTPGMPPKTKSRCMPSIGLYTVRVVVLKQTMLRLIVNRYGHCSMRILALRFITKLGSIATTAENV